MPGKKPPAASDTEGYSCAQCEYLQQQYERAITHISEALGSRFQSLSDKVRELQKWQESRDEAIEALYAHKRTHRQSFPQAPRPNAA